MRILFDRELTNCELGRLPHRRKTVGEKKNQREHAFGGLLTQGFLQGRMEIRAACRLNTSDKGLRLCSRLSTLDYGFRREELHGSVVHDNVEGLPVFESREYL